MTTERKPTDQLTPQPIEPKTPRVRVTQDEDAQPVRVKIVEEKREASAGLLAVMIFLATLLGTLIGLGADFGELLGSVEAINRLVNPPPRLCLVGSNTILGDGIPMSENWKTQFEQTNRVRLAVDGIGSVNGVQRAVEGGCVHVLAMSEPMLDEQYQSLVNAGYSLECAAEIGYDVVAFVTDINNESLLTIELGQLDDVLNGQIRTWGEITRNTGDAGRPIHLLARPGSGTTEWVLINIARHRPTPETPFPPDASYIQCDSNEECLDNVLSTPGSLYWVSTAWMRTQPPQYLKIVPILQADEAPINPLADDVDLDNYPSRLVRPMYMYVLSGQNIQPETVQLGREFLTYVRSVRGQQILEADHYYNHFDPPTEIDVPMPPGFERSPNTAPIICRS
ncbi:MAG: substrate-binding domain-containing protein [bacterium]|nr:substrate-binding domain-containing protein [bacterium]